MCGVHSPVTNEILHSEIENIMAEGYGIPYLRATITKTFRFATVSLVSRLNRPQKTLGINTLGIDCYEIFVISESIRDYFSIVDKQCYHNTYHHRRHATELELLVRAFGMYVKVYS